MVILPELVGFCEGGVSLLLGTRDASNRPACARLVGARVWPERDRVTVLVPEVPGARVLANLRDNGLIAITCSRPTDHVTCQLKGTVTHIRPATPEDYDRQGQWRRAFLGELIAVGVPAEQADAIIMQPAVAVEMQVTGVFAQTPGPGAGERV